MTIDQSMPIQYQQIKKTQYLLTVLFFLFISFFSYINILSGSFLWDDHCLIVDNPFIKQWHDFGGIFSSEVHRNSFTNYYRPLQIFSYRFDYLFFRLNPIGYHCMNIVLHACAGILLFALLIKMTRRCFLSFAASLLFIIHPVNTGAVAYISGRADPLAAIFIFSSCLLYLRSFYFNGRPVLSLSKNNIGFYAGSLCMFSCALLTKEVAIVLPFILCGIDTVLFEKKGRYKRVILFFMILVIYLLARLTVLNFSTGNPFLCKKGFAIFDIGFFARCSAFLKTLLIYMGSVFVPVDLHMERFVTVEHLSWGSYLGTLLCLAASFFAYKNLSYHFKNDSKIFYFAFFWFFIWLAPQSAFILPKIMADHFLYFPAIGLFIIVAVAIENLKMRKILLIAICFYFCSFTWFYNQIWRNEFVFFRWTAERAPSSYKAHDCLADLYLKMGRLDDAAVEYRVIIAHSLHLKTDDDIASLLFGSADVMELEKKREIASATFYNLGVVLSRQKKLEEAKTAYLNALRLNPGSEQTYNNLGLLYEEMGNLNEAEKMYREAIRLNKDYPQSYNNLAVLYMHKGETDKALKLWDKILRLNPRYESARKNIALARELILKKRDAY